MIPLYKPHMPELPKLDEILHSGKLAYGDYTKQFERRLTEFIETNGTVYATNSFNMAIAVVVSLLEIKAGDEVIASPMACLASTQPFAVHEINVRWGDVDPNTGTLAPEDVRKKITPKTKAIIHNHFCGYPGYIDEINEIGRQYGIPVIDDGIEGFGSIYKGNRLGNCGTYITIFSFNAVRLPNTVDGGAIVIRDKTLAKKAEMIRDCGIDRSVFRDEIGEINPFCDITLKGHSATMSNVNGYIGLCQMECMEGILQAQRTQATAWKRELSGRKDIKLLGRGEIDPNYWVFGILAEDKRQAILDFREKGWYASGVHLKNNVYSIFGASGELPGVDEFYSRFVALPCGWWIKSCAGT